MNEHWSRLQKQYQQVATLVDRIALRERVLLLIILITAIYFLWAMLLMSPSRKAIKSARVEEAALVKQIKESRQKITHIETQNSTTTLDKTLVTNATVIPMFKSLLEKQQGIILKGLYNLPNQPINDITLKLPLPLYKQKVHLVFNGNYFRIICFYKFK